MLLLSIFFHSHKAYRVLSCLFGLPAIGTLQHDLQKMNTKPGFSESVFEALTVKAKVMNERDCNVSLVFDKMSIKHAIAFVVRALLLSGNSL